jgi:hypothetical protein
MMTPSLYNTAPALESLGARPSPFILESATSTFLSCANGLTLLTQSIFEHIATDAPAYLLAKRLEEIQAIFMRLAWPLTPVHHSTLLHAVSRLKNMKQAFSQLANFSNHVMVIEDVILAVEYELEEID